MKLEVRQFGRAIGRLESTVDRGAIFMYDAGYLQDQSARAISRSLPLRETAYSQAHTLP